MKVVVDVLKYGELDCVIKERLYEDAKEQFVSDRFQALSDVFIEYLSNSYGIALDASQLSYSICNQQGDGVSFSFKNMLAVPHFLNLVYERIALKDKKLLQELIEEEAFTINSEGNRTSYFYAAQGQVVVDAERAVLAEEELVTEKARQLVADEYVRICKELELMGYGFWTIDENDKQDILSELNDSFYFSDGRVANSYIMK